MSVLTTVPFEQGNVLFPEIFYLHSFDYLFWLIASLGLEYRSDSKNFVRYTAIYSSKG